LCRAADLHAELDAALNNLARLLADEGRFAEAQSAVRRALALNGPNKMAADRTLREFRQKSGHIQNDDDSGTASPR
jgi:tetratricopeptide (TPR) repeat protein